jgi:hypothetical protein
MAYSASARRRIAIAAGARSLKNVFEVLSIASACGQRRTSADVRVRSASLIGPNERSLSALGQKQTSLVIQSVRRRASRQIAKA